MDKRKRGDNMEGELLRGKQRTNKNSAGGGCNDNHTAHVNREIKGKTSTLHGGGVGIFVDDLLLSDILSRLPAKSLMRFKSVCKHWRSTIQQDQYFINLYNTRSEARQCSIIKSNNDTTSTTLFIAPVKVCGEKPFRDATEMVPALDADRETGAEMRIITFSHDHEGGSSGVASVNSIHSNITLPVSMCKDPLELVSFYHSSFLEPVHGLTCFVNLENYGSVMIYNPSTRDKTSWIRTRTSISLENIFLYQKLTQQGQPVDRYRMKTVYKCMFGFGFDSTTKKHKVLCIYQVDIREFSDVDHDNYPIYEEYKVICCEVMTVGENTWREIDNDSIPPSMVVGEYDKCVHVNGSINWMCYKNESEPYFACKNNVIMAFDVGSETFRVILIPAFITEDLCRLDWDERKHRWTNELVDVDGHIAILDLEGENCKERDQCRAGHQCREGRQWINIWIYNQNNKEINSTAKTGNQNAISGSGAYWMKETLPLPYRWEELKYIAMKAITGTNLIVTKFFRNSCPHQSTKFESLIFYDRKKKEVCEKQVDMILDHTHLYDITTFLETLTRVQADNIS